jgi:hypothetical protein
VVFIQSASLEIKSDFVDGDAMAAHHISQSAKHQDQFLMSLNGFMGHTFGVGVTNI